MGFKQQNNIMVTLCEQIKFHFAFLKNTFWYIIAQSELKYKENL